MNKDRLRLLLACLATLAIVVPLAYLWQHSRLPSTYSVMSMGYDDYGGGSAHMMGPHGKTVSVKDLVDDPNRKPDKVVDLVARKGEVKLADGQKVDGYTINGTSPGPLIEITRASCSRCTCTTPTSPTASRCTGTGSMCPTPRTASPASRRTP